MTQINNQIIKVLLVDDDEDDYALTRYLFEEFKDNRYELEWTNSYYSAQTAIKEGIYDIYLIDFRLGSHSGLDLISESIAQGCDVPMILLTGQGDKEIDLEAMQAGAADYLVKGQFEAQLLERSIRYSVRHARSLKRLVHQATHDALTGLPNRTSFSNLLMDSIETAQRRNKFEFAVLFLDLDRFKVINDSLGHLVGDKLLVAISERIKSCVRPHDVVSRFGGDEFTVLLNKIKDVNEAVEVAERLQRKLAIPFIVDDFEVFTSSSIGITFADNDQRKPEDFLRDADTAMYRAKAMGKARYEIFDCAMHVRNVNLLKLENDLRRAVERNEFLAYYQPIIRLETEEICEFEALLRWNHPEHGLVAPDEFIPIAEESGLIVPIGKWILEESCRQIAQWQKDFPAHGNLAVSVNLSAKQLTHPDLTGQVNEFMRKNDLAPRCLKLEVTETTVMENADLAFEILSELCALGIHISSDDFGTGYSSLSYLHRFPFERLKIDRSFVGKMDKDAKSEEIVRSIITLAQNLHLDIVAEGIENESQLKLLRSLGCRAGQGYLFSKPVTAEYAAQLLVKGLLHNKPPTTFVAVAKPTFIEVSKVQ